MQTLVPSTSNNKSTCIIDCYQLKKIQINKPLKNIYLSQGGDIFDHVYSATEASFAILRYTTRKLLPCTLKIICECLLPVIDGSLNFPKL